MLTSLQFLNEAISIWKRCYKHPISLIKRWLLRMQMSKGLCILLSALIQHIRWNIYHESSKLEQVQKLANYDHYSLNHFKLRQCVYTFKEAHISTTPTRCLRLKVGKALQVNLYKPKESLQLWNITSQHHVNNCSSLLSLSNNKRHQIVDMKWECYPMPACEKLKARNSTWVNFHCCAISYQAI